MLLSVKIIGLICFLLFPLIPLKKRKGTGLAQGNESDSRSSYGVTEDGDLTLITEEEKRLDY